jgi:hypothetical protein
MGIRVNWILPYYHYEREWILRRRVKQTEASAAENTKINKEIIRPEISSKRIDKSRNNKERLMRSNSIETNIII